MKTEFPQIDSEFMLDGSPYMVTAVNDVTPTDKYGHPMDFTTYSITAIRMDDWQSYRREFDTAPKSDTARH